MFGFAEELFPISRTNKLANVLVEYQRLVKKNQGQCEAKTFQDCVQEEAKEIPLNERCMMTDSTCDNKEM